jgi:hypothetical protein
VEASGYGPQLQDSPTPYPEVPFRGARMPDNIVKLGGVSLPSEPVPDVVEELKGLLDLAEKGVIRAIAWAAVKSNESTSNGFIGDNNTNHKLGYSISVLQHRFFHEEYEKSVEEA